jgi:hypothetical protein
MGLYIGRSSRLGVSPAPHLAFRIFTPFKGFFFLLRHPAVGSRQVRKISFLTICKCL